MSLSTPVIAALGAVALIGAGTLGGSYAYASGQHKPVTTQATITIGRDSHRIQPSCFNGGKPLDDATNKACSVLFSQPNKWPTLTVKSSDRIGVGLDPDSAKNGWTASTNGGGGQGVQIAPYQKDTTFSGLVPAANVLSSVRDTHLTILEYDPNSPQSSSKQSLIAVWFIDLKNNAAPVGTPDTSGDASQGDGSSQGQ
ncbi:hypothetical protein [Kitasatospora viridis]|uniref:Uncharacterized protein n=1 Tax=Kitasatospora viridis TaxID=281105 RepID=A0A561UGD6_9ACTN|nr:hypothetical protein [Kitasatospora viridis]TWF98423.1 hypothetical protein FHX73_112231 [Kitasatospora viridis]